MRKAIATRPVDHVIGAWSSFEVCALSQVACRGVRQHAETLTHRLATRAYFLPQLPKVIVGHADGKYESDSQLFRGGVPQVADWLKAWRACRSPMSFCIAEQTGATFDFIHSTRLPVAMSRKAFRSMVRVMAFVLRARKLRALRAASSVCLSLDDRGAYRLVRFKCDQPSPADAAGSTAWSGSTVGVLGVMRRGGAPSSKTFDEVSDDYSRQMASSIIRAVDALCTDINGVTDEHASNAIKKAVRIGTADGGAPAQKCLEFLAAGDTPNMLASVRDHAHKSHKIRGSTRDALTSEQTFQAWYDDVFGGKHALVPDIMNSDAWLEKLLLAQRVLLQWGGAQGGGLSIAQHVLRFAKQRFESCASPQRQFCCMYVAIALVLAFVASDPRSESSTRRRAEQRLRQMPGFMMPQGVAASWSAEALEFIRLFDVADHDPALTWRQWHTFQDRMTKLFLNGQISWAPTQILA